MKRTDEIERLKELIKNLESILNDDEKIMEIIAQELKDIAEKYGKPRKTMLIYKEDVVETEVEEEVPDYPVHLFFTKHQYFKKITPQSLRMSSDQKLKDGDEILQTIEANNNFDLLFFTDKQQVYKAKVADFVDSKASVMGEFVPAKLEMDQDESALCMIATQNYAGCVLFFFENGKVAKVTLEAYKTKTNRKKLVKAYSDKSRVVGIKYLGEEKDFVVTSSAERALVFNTSMLNAKTTKSTQGVSVMSLKKGHRVVEAKELDPKSLTDVARYYRPKKLPAVGTVPNLSADQPEQLTL